MHTLNYPHSSKTLINSILNIAYIRVVFFIFFIKYFADILNTRNLCYFCLNKQWITIMRILLFVCVLQMLFYNTYCQTTAIFSLRDDSQYVLCYTEYSNGIPVKNTELEFKNTSSCSGNCRYIFDFGDNTPQVIKDNTSNTSHFYTTDGIFDVRLQVLSLTSIHDSIKNRPIISVVFLSHEMTYSITNWLYRYR